MSTNFALHISDGVYPRYHGGGWTARLTLLHAPGGTTHWSAHVEVYLPWVQPHGAHLILPCWLLAEDIDTTAETLRRSLDRGWSLARALHWADTDQRPPWLANEYGWRTHTTGLQRIIDGRAFLELVHDLESSSDTTLTAAGTLIENWPGTSQELWDTATAIAGST